MLTLHCRDARSHHLFVPGKMHSCCYSKTLLYCCDCCSSGNYWYTCCVAPGCWMEMRSYAGVTSAPDKLEPMSTLYRQNPCGQRCCSDSVLQAYVTNGKDGSEEEMIAAIRYPVGSLCQQSCVGPCEHLPPCMYHSPACVVTRNIYTPDSRQHLLPFHLRTKQCLHSYGVQPWLWLLLLPVMRMHHCTAGSTRLWLLRLPQTMPVSPRPLRWMLLPMCCRYKGWLLWLRWRR